MADHPLLQRIHGIRARAHRRHQCDFPELQREIDILELEVAELIGRPCHCGQDDGAPATVTVTLHSKETSSMSETTFEPGQTFYAQAVVDNKEGVALTDTGTWTTTAGTVAPVDGQPGWASIVGAPDGDFTVTYTASNGVAGQAEGTVSDDVPATVTVTLSATGPADANTPPSA